MIKKKDQHTVFQSLLDRYSNDQAKQHHLVRIVLWTIGILFICLIVGKFIILSSYQKQPTKPSVSVVVAPARKGEIPVYIKALGTVTPTDNITVKTQINGLLLRFLVEEGQPIKKGQLLAEIDSRLYEAQLLQYEGQLVRDSALLANARLDLQRYQALFAQNAVSKQILDTQISLVKQYEGDVMTDKGLIETAKVNISYCHITSPITGRVGLRLVDPGNFVQTTDTTGIIVLNALSPITVVFSVPEDTIPEILSRMECHKPLQIEAYDRWENKLLAKSKSVVLDNLIDTTTGTLRLKAEYDNKDSKLFPNQFVNIQLLVNTLQNAIIVPTAAIQHGAQGPFVFAVANDRKVHVKPVVVKVTHKDDTAITGKICAGELVVTLGVDKLSDGTLVNIKSKQSDQNESQKNGTMKGPS